MAETTREPGDWGEPCPVVGARKTFDLNSAGQQELCDFTIDVRAGTIGNA